jgi:arylsulfatase A
VVRVREEGVDPVALSEPEAERQGNPPVQLYHLESDPEERNNVHEQYPEVVAELTARIRKQIERGRSTPGPDQKNERPVRIGLR